MARITKVPEGKFYIVTKVISGHVYTAKSSHNYKMSDGSVAHNDCTQRLLRTTDEVEAAIIELWKTLPPSRMWWLRVYEYEGSNCLSIRDVKRDKNGFRQDFISHRAKDWRLDLSPGDFSDFGEELGIAKDY